MTWNLTADGIRNLLVADFWNHASAGHSLLDSLWNPLLAADCLRRTLNANHLCAAWIAWVNHALLHNWARNALGFSHPFAAANVNRVAFSNRLADGVAHVLVAGLVDRLADVVANSSVAGLVNGLANRIAAFTVAGLVTRLANFAGHVAVARFVHWLADVVGAGLVAGRVDRLANRVAFITVAGFVDILCAGHRNGFCALIVHSLHAGILLSFPDDFSHSLTLWTTATLGCHEVTAWRTRGCWTAGIATPSEQTCHQNTAVQQQNDCSSGSQHEPFHCLYLD